MGVDLSQVRDLTSVVRLWSPSRDRYVFDAHLWTPQATYESLPEHLKALYGAAKDSGVLTIQPGKVIDFDEINDYIRTSFDEYGIQQVGYDPWKAKELFGQLEEDGFPVLAIPQNKAALSWIAKKFEARVVNNQLLHDGDPFVRWQVENAHAWSDVNENIKIQKGPDPTKKIDTVHALLNAFAVVEEGSEPEGDFNFYYKPFSKDGDAQPTVYSSREATP